MLEIATQTPTAAKTRLAPLIGRRLALDSYLSFPPVDR